MPKPICVSCRRFYRMKKNGVPIEEGRPLSTDAKAGDELGWGPYKLWLADLWTCPSCDHQLVAGFGSVPIAEHYESSYELMTQKFVPLIRVNDC